MLRDLSCSSGVLLSEASPEVCASTSTYRPPFRRDHGHGHKLTKDGSREGSRRDPEGLEEGISIRPIGYLLVRNLFVAVALLNALSFVN